MKQTAVEWLVSKLNLFSITKEEHYEILCQIELEAKEMEKQQCYSEEDMIAFGEDIFKHSLLTHTKGVKNLFEQFKNK
jgi:hypothetical protein